MPKHTRTNWLYWLKAPDSKYLIANGRGLTGQELAIEFGINPSHLIFMRNRLLSSYKTAHGLLGKSKKLLKSTKATLKNGKEVRVELAACYNWKVKRVFWNKELVDPPKNDTFRWYRMLDKETGEYRNRLMRVKTGHRKTIKGSIALTKSNRPPTAREKHQLRLKMRRKAYRDSKEALRRSKLTPEELDAEDFNSFYESLVDRAKAGMGYRKLEEITLEDCQRMWAEMKELKDKDVEDFWPAVYLPQSKYDR